MNTLTHTHTHTHTHTQTHTRIHTHAYTHMHTQTLIHTDTCLHTHTRTHTHAYTHAHTHTHTHAHTRTQTHLYLEQIFRSLWAVQPFPWKLICPYPQVLHSRRIASMKTCGLTLERVPFFPFFLRNRDEMDNSLAQTHNVQTLSCIHMRYVCVCVNKCKY